MTRFLSTHRIALWCVVSGLVLAGCGSSSSGLSKAQLASKVNKTCTSFAAQAKAIPPPTSRATIGPYLDREKPLVHSEFHQLTSLKPDSSVRSDYQAFVQHAMHALGLFDDALAKEHASSALPPV